MKWGDLIDRTEMFWDVSKEPVCTYFRLLGRDSVSTAQLCPWSVKVFIDSPQVTAGLCSDKTLFTKMGS